MAKTSFSLGCLGTYQPIRAEVKLEIVLDCRTKVTLNFPVNSSHWCAGSLMKVEKHEVYKLADHRRRPSA